MYMCAWILEITYCYVDYFCTHVCACIRYNTEHSLWELEVTGCKMGCIGTLFLALSLLYT